MSAAATKACRAMHGSARQEKRPSRGPRRFHRRIRAFTMLPATLTIVDDDEVYGEHLAAHLRRQGVRVRSFADSNHLLTAPEPFGDAFYVLDLMLPGVAGEELIRILRLRSDAGVLVVTGKAEGDVFENVLGAGADMHLAKPVSLAQITLAIEAVWRRIETQRLQARRAWTLDVARQRLTAPDGEVIDLAENDVAILSCFPNAPGGVVERKPSRACSARSSTL